MTESEWLSATQLRMTQPMGFANQPQRKQWLFACACCRRIWPKLTDGSCRRLIQVRELHAVGAASEEDMEQATEAARRVRRRTSMAPVEQGYDFDGPEGAADWAERASCYEYPDWVALLARHSVGCLEPLRRDARQAEEEAAQCDLIRDIFGNPFRPVMSDPKWRSPTADTLARGIYMDRAFDRLPILADALEEARCDNSMILNHCRAGGTHVRGCWVVDLLLGYE